MASSLLKEVYNPKAVIPHAASLHQASAHCAIFPTAASRRSLGRVSVPVWPVTLSGRLPVVALVSHYPTNKLIGREPIQNQSNPFHPPPCDGGVVSSIRPGFPGLSQSQGQVTHVLLTRSPLITPASGRSSFDLHVLSTPPAFVLSQDQTLRQKTEKQTHPPRNRSRTSERSRPKKTTHTPRRRDTGDPSTKQNIWYQQTWHTIEFSNNRPRTRTPKAPKLVSGIFAASRPRTTRPGRSDSANLPPRPAPRNSRTPPSRTRQHQNDSGEEPTTGKPATTTGPEPRPPAATRKTLHPPPDTVKTPTDTARTGCARRPGTASGNFAATDFLLPRVCADGPDSPVPGSRRC